LTGYQFVRAATIDIEYMPSIIMRFARMRMGACYMRNPLDLGGYIVYNKEYTQVNLRRLRDEYKSYI